MAPLDRKLLNIGNCTCCPHACGADRHQTAGGFCRTGDEVMVSSVCAHRGEEPVISGSNGVCNIFFAHCNLQCLYCQNYQISRNDSSGAEYRSVSVVVDEVERVLDEGARGVGFVSPSHFIPKMLDIIRELEARGRREKYIFNSNGYDRAEIVGGLEGSIDVFLPDLKYMDEDLARAYSGVKGYPQVATQAIREMYRQMGSSLLVDNDGYIERGLIIRHLVLPGHAENSKEVLRWIAAELSPSVHISLMSQYYPTPVVRDHPQLGRTLRSDEYQEVLDEFERLGFYRGWVQQMESEKSYRPDFDRHHPFEE